MADASAAALCADEEVTAHPEKFYDRIIEIDLDALEPYLNGPFTPDAAVAEKGCEKEFAFLELLEQRAIECFKRVKGTKKQVCPNVDFYSGFIYELIGLPEEIYTPLFAMARIVGWTAHRIEELNFEGRRIIRPAYKNVLEEVTYTPISQR